MICNLLLSWAPADTVPERVMANSRKSKKYLKKIVVQVLKKLKINLIHRHGS